jgi:preprotein translocase subunit SecD
MQPEEKVSDDVMSSLLTSMQQRLNVYGLSDISVRKSTDLSGNQFVVVEIAGANEQEVKDLLSQQGKFEAKIGNQTVFSAGMISHMSARPQTAQA